MISYKYKFIHIHIPRTGGTSILNALSEQNCFEAYHHIGGGGFWGPPMVVDGIDIWQKWVDFFGPQKLERAKHFTAQDYLDFLGKEEYDKYYKFTFVRNPLQRLKSITSFNWKRPHEMDTEGNRWLIDQICYIMDSEENIIVDDIFKFENIKEDYKTLQSKLATVKGFNTSSTPELPHANVASREIDPSFYTTEVLTEWREILVKEFNLFYYE